MNLNPNWIFASPFRSRHLHVPHEETLARKVEGKSGELAESDELAFGRAAAQIAAAEMGVKINFKTGEEVWQRCRLEEK